MAASRRTAPAADIKDTLWKAADKLRGSMDAAEYKHFVLGLVFLKYVSDAFEERREQIARQLTDDGITGDTAAELLDDPDAYIGEGVFYVPELARYDQVAARAKNPPGEMSIGEVIDSAMVAIEKKNPDLEGVLPKIFNRTSVDQRRLGELIDLIGRVGFRDQPKKARDLLGETYEYFLEMFAKAEGKRGGEFYTPASVVRLLVEVLEPRPRERVYDPCCGSGGMFVQAERFIESHGGRPLDISVFGQELNQNTWRLGKMNLAIHGIGANLGEEWGDTFHEDRHPDLRADVVLANPPFNISDWGGERLGMDPRWKYGVPPVGNANFAWLQHIASKLSPRGRAGIVLANGSMSSKQSGEGEIRRAMVEDDLISCLIALPPQLFRNTQIPACLWFLARDKGPSQGLNDRRGEVLFIDARDMGEMRSRTERVLTDEEIAEVAGTYHAWRGTSDDVYVDDAGFSYSASLDEIKQHDFILTPGRYVGTAVAEADTVPLADKFARLTKELQSYFAESDRLQAEVNDQLGRLDV
ncbi:class I SAM-dependent DNA methyltransferase [Sphaerimonospora thailandensis]|uniref:site-specific DNA-methyltransferase (adenine-specific) n=1 Tax=Sphaerimonospora thailandensis TaxID=795644 RepID=A0A8J3R894_9ACTN|nr:class I SAM-dependent DNA methyltransferase [Sphaerimonospora thailandensis]GIH69234.1 type I restriction endonuclease subunit M [Sphaerimonospora thailandensis]